MTIHDYEEMCVLRRLGKYRATFLMIHLKLSRHRL